MMQLKPYLDMNKPTLDLEILAHIFYSFFKRNVLYTYIINQAKLSK